MKHVGLKTQKSGTARTAGRRRGSIFPIFLISLILVAATSAILVRTTLTQRALVRSEERRLQADWLVQSASARAAAKLAADAAYSGETWLVSQDEIQQTNGASIEIVVSKLGDSATRPGISTTSHRQVDITVNYPAEGNQRVRLSRQLLVKLP
jgi:hypothetical protein